MPHRRGARRRRPSWTPPDLGGGRRAALRAGLPAGLPAHRQRARRRGPHPGRLRPGVPLAAHLHARHLRGLAAPHHHQRLPRQDAPQAAHPLRRALRRRRRPAAQPRARARADATTTPTSTTTCSARSTPCSPDFRAAVVLCDIEGLSYEEIAATLGIKLGTVRSRIHRGRAQLREALAHRAPRGPLGHHGSTQAPGRPPAPRRGGRVTDAVRVASRLPGSSELADYAVGGSCSAGTGSGRGTATSSPAQDCAHDVARRASPPAARWPRGCAVDARRPAVDAAWLVALAALATGPGHGPAERAAHRLRLLARRRRRRATAAPLRSATALGDGRRQALSAAAAWTPDRRPGPARGAHRRVGLASADPHPRCDLAAGGASPSLQSRRVPLQLHGVGEQHLIVSKSLGLSEAESRT